MSRFLLLVLLVLSSRCFSQLEKQGSNIVYLNSDTSNSKFEVSECSKCAFSVTPGKMYYWYFKNHLHSTEGAFSGKVLHGGYVSYYTDNQLKEKGNFKHGLKCGNWSNWYENGLLRSKQKYKKGLLSGLQSSYSLNGVESKSRYRNGIEVMKKNKPVKKVKPDKN